MREQLPTPPPASSPIDTFNAFVQDLYAKPGTLSMPGRDDVGPP